MTEALQPEGSAPIAEDRILDELRAALMSRASSLANDFSLDPGLEAQVRAIIAEVNTRLLSPHDPAPIAVDYRADRSLVAHGVRAALHDIDPAEPLMAAEILFDVTLAKIVAMHPGVDAGTVARVLHSAIWRRFPPGAIAYVDALRAQLANAYFEGRRSLSRELHDGIAQDVLAALQRLELAENADKADCRTSLNQVATLLHSTVDGIHSLASDLRRFVGGKELDDAIADYVRDMRGDHLTIVAARSGSPRVLPSIVREEAFSIVLEAVRNARAHAMGASQVRIGTHWSSNSVLLEVSDDGAGLTVGRRRPGRLGMTGMNERAERIGASLRVEGLNPGTRLTLTIPLAYSPTL